jgi:hypothetical protein
MTGLIGGAQRRLFSAFQMLAAISRLAMPMNLNVAIGLWGEDDQVWVASDTACHPESLRPWVSVARLQTFLLDAGRVPAGQSSIRIAGMLNRYSITGVMLHTPNHVDCLVSRARRRAISGRERRRRSLSLWFHFRGTIVRSVTRSKYLLNHRRVTE